jgi:hypothetical protein
MTVDRRTLPSFTTRLWSEEVGMAGAIEPLAADVGYRFGNGRTFAPAAYGPARVAVVPVAALVAVVASCQTASTLARGEVASDAPASTAQGQGSAVFMGDDGTAYAAMAQAQAVLAGASVGVDAVAAAAQAQVASGVAGDAGTVFGASATGQGQSASASAGVTLALAVAGAQAQHGSALAGVATGMAHTSRQAQSSAARAEQGSMLVATSQAQQASGAAALSMLAQGSTEQGQSVAAAVGVAVAVQGATSQGQRAGAHVGGDGYVFGATRQGQTSAANASLASAVQVSLQQGQRSAAAVARASAGVVANRQGQRILATASVGSGAVVAARQAQCSTAAAGSVSALVAGATLYVAPTGADTNSGLAGAPLRTIQRAVTLAVAGDVVSVAPGTYVGGIVGTRAGTANSPIRFVSAVRWGAKIVPPATSTREYGWENNGAYVIIDGFEVDGSTDPASGSHWRVGIGNNGEGGIVRHCHVHHIDRSGSSSDGGGAGVLMDSWYGHSNMQATGNWVHHVGPSSGSSLHHGIYFTAAGSVENNVCWQNTGGGIHLWHDARHVDVVHNTCFGNGYGIIFGGGDYVNLAAPCDFVTVANNICYANAEGIRTEGDIGPGCLVVSNLCNANTVRNYGTTTTHSADVSGDPLFVNYQLDGSGDYHLQAGSPARNAGNASYAAATDFDGYARPVGGAADLGAYEYGAS